MFNNHLVIDADSHKCENPAVFLDFIPAPYRRHVRFVRDRFGEQRFCITDRRGGQSVDRVFLQPEGYGKGTFRPYHEETTLGGLFNRVRIEHMDREGIDHQVIFGSIPLAFNSLSDSDLCVALCRAYNDYIHSDTSGHADRLHPVGFLPLTDPAEALKELRRCVLQLGMPGVCVPANIPMPHPAAPDAFPEIRVPKQLSHPDFHEIYEEAERLDVPIAIHAVPGAQYAGGTSDQLESFTLVHVFANRSMQQMAMSSLMFDGTLDRFPQLRFGFMEAGAGWLPEFVHSLHEHWEKRIIDFDPSIEPSIGAFLKEFARETGAPGHSSLLSKARQLLACLSPGSAQQAAPAEIEAFRNEHPRIRSDPRTFVERGQVYVTIEPDDPAPLQLHAALGELGTRVACLAVDYGHWDATLRDCVSLVAERPGITSRHAERLLATNALDFYGSRLRARIEPSLAAVG